MVHAIIMQRNTPLQVHYRTQAPAEDGSTP